MPRSRFLIAAWLLLLVPTLLVGWVALRSARLEGARIDQAERASATERAASIAATLDSSVREVRLGLLATLSSIPAGADITTRLDRWRAANPLVRNVFLWDPERGLLFPPDSRPRGEEDSSFAERYAALFDGRASWGQSTPPGENSSPADPVPYTPLATPLSGRRQLRELAVQDVTADPAAAAPATTRRTGWVPWYAENRLHLLGWAESSPDAARYGLEVELMAMLSRLLPDFPAPTGSGESYILWDGSGRVFHRRGTVDGEGAAHVTVPVGPELPHWQVSVAWTPRGAVGRGFALLSTLLVGSFVVAILFGGSLLLWQARLLRLDAERKTNFVSNVSHELKTPLTTIRMYAELLAEGRVQDLAKQRDYLGVIVSESQRLTRLVNNVLDFSRLEQGRKSYAAVPLDLAEILHGVLEALAARFRESGVQLREELPPRGAAVLGDRDAFEQIFLNLLDNALKYASEGNEITVQLIAHNSQWKILFEDRGPGIPAAHRKRVFDKFHRVDGSLTACRAGSGLGLSIARQLARGLGGELAYRDRPGGGACFELTVPALTEETP